LRRRPPAKLRAEARASFLASWESEHRALTLDEVAQPRHDRQAPRQRPLLILIDPAGRQGGAFAQHVQPVLVVEAEQHPAEIGQQHLSAIAVHCPNVAALRRTCGQSRKS